MAEEPKAQGQHTLWYTSQGGSCPWCRIDEEYFIYLFVLSHSSAHTSLGAHTSPHTSAHTSLGAQTSTHTSAHASLGAHTSAHTIFRAHTSAHTSSRMCTLLARVHTSCRVATALAKPVGLLTIQVLSFIYLKSTGRGWSHISNPSFPSCPRSPCPRPSCPSSSCLKPSCSCS